MKYISFLLLVGTFFIVTDLAGQRGTSVFSFSSLSPSARLTALGQHGTALMDMDPALSRANPASLSENIGLTASLQQGFLSPGIQLGQAFVANRKESWDLQWIAGASYVSYGDITAANQFGQRMGDFTSRDLSFFVGVSKKVYERLYAGASVEFLQSEIAEFSSYGLASHLGLMYVVEEKQISVGLAWRNIGWQWSPFAFEQEGLRSQLNLAVAKRLEHLPLRFSVNYHSMNRWNLLYDSEVGEESLQEEASAFGMWVDNFTRHLAVNAEIFIGKGENFMLRLGYDHQRRKELTLPNWGSLAGFSGGFGLNIRGVNFDYGFGSYHLGGGIHHLGLRFDVHRWTKKEVDIL
jgi:hypothetical protein